MQRCHATPVGLAVLLAGGLTLLLLSGPSARGDEARAGKPQYVGSTVCENCHQAEHALWTGSSHFHTFERATAENMPAAVTTGATVSHPPGRTRFHGEDGRYLAETTGPDGKLRDYPLTHVVGRMRVKMFVATLPDGRQQVLPAMLEQPTQKWFDYSHLIFGAGGTDWLVPPVIETGSPSFWTGAVRSFDARCASCHVSGYEPRRPDAQGKGPRYRMRRAGIDCESCHGPASAHVDFRESKAQGIDPILHFADLPHDRALGVCLQCHMEAEVVDSHFLPGEDVFEYRTPTLLVDPERVDPSGRSLELIYDGLAVSVSRCVAQGKLTCISCHDPHGSSNPSQLREDPLDDKLCTRCHEALAAAGSAHTHHEAAGSGSRCVNCHMPFLEVERRHGVIADHSISTPRFDLVGDRVAKTTCVWCHEQGVGAPPEAPKLAAPELKAAHARWWPEGSAAKPWMMAIGKARLEEEDAYKGLLEILADKGQRRLVRASAAELLGKPAYAKRTPLALLAYARDADSMVRRKAVASLASLEGALIDKALLRALSDDSRGVRVAAARAALEGWKRVQGNRALLDAVIPVLAADAADGPEDDMRWFRLGAAHGIAGHDAQALEAYERDLELDPFAEYVRREVERLRKKLGK